MSLIKKATTPIFILLILTGLLGASFQPALAGSCNQYHTVQRGEYLVLIARQYGVHWRDLAAWNNLAKPELIFTGQKLCVSAEGIPVTAPGSQPSQGTTPTIEITGVKADETVTIQTKNFPANVRFDVLMGERGTQGIGGVKVDSLNSGQGGSFTATFAIPAELRGRQRIVIRLDSPTTGFFSYNTFTNVSTGTVPEVRTPEVIRRESDASARLTFQRRLDLSHGNGGIFLPSSNYTGFAALSRIPFEELPESRRLEFVQEGLQFNFFDDQGKAFPRAFGMIYVYFNLTGDTRAAWNSGDLGIYRYNTSRNTWVSCDFGPYLIQTTNRPNGRLACVVTDFGLYGLAVEK